MLKNLEIDWISDNQSQFIEKPIQSEIIKSQKPETDSNL